MPLPALLIPVLYSAGFGAVIDGLISAITASGDATPEAIEQAKQEFVASGLPDDVAQRMAEDVANEVTTGDRVQAGIGGAARGAAFGALGGAAVGGLSKAASAVAPKLKSFLPGANNVSTTVAPTVATEQELAQLGTQAAKRQASIQAAEGQRLAAKTAKGMNAPAPTMKPRSASEIRQEIAAREAGGRRIDSDDPIYYELEKAIDAEDVYSAGFRSPGIDAMRRGSGDRVIPIGGNIGYSPETRATLVGRASGGSHPMEGASSKLGKLVQGDVWPEEAVAVGRLGMRSPRTIETTAELVSPGIGMADDALLNPAIDDIIDAAMAPVARRIGYRLNGRVPMPTIDPTQGAMSIPSFLR